VAFDHFDLLAKVYDRLIPPPDPEDLIRLLQLPIAGRLLDVGGGTGRVAATLRTRAGAVVVSDLSPKMLQQARRKEGLQAVRAHAERLPFPDKSFDRVLVVDALHHFCDQRAAIQDLVRILAPGGRLVIEEPDYTRFAVKLVAVAEKLALMRSRFFTPEVIAQMASSHARATSIERDNRFRAWILIDG
jgi:demethylmenaquinone methyltransferase/2-methoxy-6-polyprenyl-1,4-benzoquinol methylase